MRWQGNHHNQAGHHPMNLSDLPLGGCLNAATHNKHLADGNPHCQNQAPQCDGNCVMAGEVLEDFPMDQCVYAHPDCPLHGEHGTQ